MVPRRAPAGSLAALAVVLAALAVVVVAGGRAAILRVATAPPTTVTAPTSTGGPPSRHHDVPPGTGGASAGVTGVGSAPVGGAPPHRTPSTPTNYPTPPVTSTTVPPAPPTTTTTIPRDSRSSTVRDSGWFAGTSTVVHEFLGPVRTVTVSLSASMEFTLDVTCADQFKSSSAVETAKVVLHASPASCIATIELSRPSLAPTSWRLVAQ